MTFDYDIEGNQLTLDQFNDLKVLAKLADADGSVRKLINSAFELRQNFGGKFTLMIPYIDSTTHSSDVKPKPKLRSLPSKCSISLVESNLSQPLSTIADLTYDVSCGGTFEVKPSSQLGSYVYFVAVDYAIEIIKLKLTNGLKFTNDLSKHQGIFQYRRIFFDDDLMSGTTNVVRHKIMVVNTHPIVSSELITHSQFQVSTSCESVDSILQGYDYATRNSRISSNCLNKRTTSHSASGIISTSSMVLGGSIIEDDDFGR